MRRISLDRLSPERQDAAMSEPENKKTERVDEHIAGKIPATGWYIALLVIAALLALSAFLNRS